MATLTVASKANQATTLPVLLVAYFANESDPNVSITFRFEEVEVLESSNSVVELVIGDGSPIIGLSSCLDKLIQEYLVLSGKDDNRVGQDLGSFNNKYTH